jgi:hypothetical protein
MWTAEAVLICALEMLGRTATTLPPIKFVAVPPPGVPATAEAYVDTNRKAIHLITSSPVFRRAQNARWRCSEVAAIRKLASVLVHEEWHVRNGPSETGAYQAQLMTLLLLHADPGDTDFQAVRRAMRTVTARQKEAVRETLASAGHLVDAEEASLRDEALRTRETPDDCFELYESPVVWHCVSRPLTR